MATIDDLLLQAAAEETNDETLVINNDLRTISIPPGVKCLGVESDADVLLLQFRMPSTYCGFDLSEFAVRINYMNAKGEGDVYPVTDAVVDADAGSITFTWLVGRRAVAYRGATSFIVCLKKVDATGAAVKEFNTTTASLPVLAGLETSEKVAQQNPDVLESILLRLDTLAQGGASDEQIAQAVADYLVKNPIEGTGTVKSVNGVEPDAAGNVEITIPDSSQNVELDTTLTQSGKAADAKAVGDKIAEITGISLVEPADDDVPQVYLTGIDGAAAPTTKGEGEVDFQLHYVSKSQEFTAYCTLKLQGDSSAATEFKKKNYTVKMFSDAAHESKLKKEFRDWGFESNKYVLKANWIDASHARLMVAYDIWSKIVKTRKGYADSVEATLPNQGTSDGFPVVVYINGTYYGIYTWILPKSDVLFGVDEDDPNQFVIYGQLNTNGTFRKTANNFRALWSGADVDNWEIEVGTNSAIVKTAVNDFTNFVMTATDEEFHANLGNYCDVNSLIDGYLYDYYICGLDALAQNMILICRDGKTFKLGVWDRDSTFGLFWTGGMVSANYRCPEDYQEPFSLLWARLEGTFYEELKARKAELRAEGAPLSFGNIVGTFDTYVHKIGAERYDENNAAYSQPSKNTATKTQFRQFVRDRLAYVDSCVDNFGTLIKCADITLTESAITIDNVDTHTLTAVLVPSATTQEIVWESSNESVVIVEGGVVTAVGNGSATITATCGQYSATCAVESTFGEIACTGISLSANTLTFTADGSQTLTATVTPDGCTDPVTWESDNTGVATVNGGVVTAIANGSATITAKCGTYSASCSVVISGIGTVHTVTNKLNGVTTSNTNTTVADGESYTAILTASTGAFGTVTVTMGGVDVTADVYADGVITISSVNGDIAITATAYGYVDYDTDALVGVTWTNGYTYDRATGELTATSGENCSSKFKLYNCVYQFAAGMPQYTALFVWDESGNYLYSVEDCKTAFAANPAYTYAVKFYATNPTKYPSLMPVDNTETAVEQFEFDLAAHSNELGIFSSGKTYMNTVHDILSVGFSATSGVLNYDGIKCANNHVWFGDILKLVKTSNADTKVLVHCIYAASNVVEYWLYTNMTSNAEVEAYWEENGTKLVFN